MERMFTVSQVAALLGLGIDAVRFYEKKGLDPAAGSSVRGFSDELRKE